MCNATSATPAGQRAPERIPPHLRQAMRQREMTATKTPAAENAWARSLQSDASGDPEPMQIWHLDREIAPGASKPAVLFSTPEARGIRINLLAGEALEEHSVRERAIVTVLGGRVEVQTGGSTTMCEPGAVVLLEPHERHSIRAQDVSHLLLVLAPWPAPDHYDESESAPSEGR
jgi:quercetin dioxygenase-like cupin family protein